MRDIWASERTLQAEILLGIYREDETRASAGPGAAPANRGQRGYPDGLTELLEVRTEILAGLRALPTAEAERELRAQIELERERLRGLEDGEAAALLADHERGTESLFAASLVVAERLHWLRQLADALSGDACVSYETELEGELRWLDAQAEELTPEGRALSSEGAALRARVRDSRHALHAKSVDEWLTCFGDRQPSDRDATEQSSPRRQFRSAWERVLDAHELLSDLQVIGYTEPTRLDAVRRERQRSREVCRELFRSAVGEEREGLIVEAATRTENHVSGLLSEGDLLNTCERVVKYRAAVDSVDDLTEVLEHSGVLRQEWFGAESLRSVRFQREFGHLRWVRRYALRSAQSAEVEARMKARFGPRRMRLVENVIFALIFVLVGLVVAEWRMEAAGVLTLGWALGFQLADLAICTVLLVDLFVRWKHAGWAPWYFRRHLVFDFLPAVPFGFLLGWLWVATHVVETSIAAVFQGNEVMLDSFADLVGVEQGAVSLAMYAHLLLVLRVVRALRFVRGLRVVVTGLRMARLAVFLIRGMDRAVQRFRGFLDRNVLMFESDPERGATESPVLRAIAQEEAHRARLSRELHRDLPLDRRVVALNGQLAMLECEIALLPPEPSRTSDRRHVARDLHLETLITRLLTCDQMVIQNALGHREVQRLASILRWASLPIVRALPLVKRWVQASKLPDPTEAVAEAARQLGQFLERALSIFYLGGDLSGITTGPQILDRVATAMIKSTQRPAFRLIVIGGVPLLFSAVLELLGNVFEFGSEASNSLLRFLETFGVPFFVLGSICLVVNVIGRWFKRIAGEALDVYLRTAEAHFFHLVKEVKAIRFDKDIEDLRSRVVLPECRLRSLTDEQVQAASMYLERKLDLLAHARPASALVDLEEHDRFTGFLFREMEQVALLYRDYLDGTLLERTDDKTSTQLLGNLAMREIRSSMLGMGKRELRRLERLSLEKDRLLGFGPYLWFRFISESLAIETAKLVMEYNACCVPLDRIDNAHPDTLDRYLAFLDKRRDLDDISSRRAQRSIIDFSAATMVTTEFNALHFLVPSVERDKRVERIFGDQVLHAMYADRRAMVRDVFGTWPYHLLPRSVRRINPYRLYFRYLGGARVLLLPLVLAARCAGILGRLFVEFVRIVREVLGTAEVRQRRSRIAGFDVAVRKINRMRKPYFMEAMRLRAAVDAEYLGLQIPGVEQKTVETTYAEDLDIIGAIERERLPFKELRRKTIRDLRRLRVFLTDRGWLGREFSDCLRILDPTNAYEGREFEVLRALVSAFITDQHSLRTTITGPREIRNFVGEVLRQRPPGLVFRSWGVLKHDLLGAFSKGKKRRRELFDRYAEVDERLGAALPRDRKRVLRALLDAPPSTEKYCEVAIDLATARESYDASVLDALRRVASDHALWSRKLVTLRMIQSLTVLDVRAYRELIWTLGGYGEEESTLDRSGRQDREAVAGAK